jgi:biopolymer transport protein ExbB
VPFNYLNKMVEDAEHNLEVAASKLELIIEKNKKHEEELRLRHRQKVASEDPEAKHSAVKVLAQEPLPA